jgi:hypothetical protein
MVEDQIAETRGKTATRRRSAHAPRVLKHL